MKKIMWIVIVLAIIIVALLAVLIFVPAKPKSAPLQTGIVVTSPKLNEEISSPLKITGVVNGDGWSGFEGQVGSVRLLDGNGTEIISGPLTTTTEWTKLPTNFEVTLQFDAAPGNATLVFHNENPSGMPEKDETFTLPVKLAESVAETTTVKAYFNNNKMDPEISCNKVFAVQREIPKTTAVAGVALSELLKGPTNAEKDQGFFTSIPAGSKLNSISIVNGQARADFNETTESGGGSCSMATRVAQITQTLKQFSTITSVKLSINGRTGDIFQP